MVDAAVAIGVPLLLIGAVLFIIEVLHPGAFLLIPGSIFLAAGIMYLLLPNPLTGSVVGPAVIVVAAFLATVATIPYYRRIAPVHRPMSSIPMSLEGQTGVVVRTVEPNSLKGKVRVQSEIWSARSTQVIPEGALVKVLGGEGVAIQVVPVEAPPAA